jgi:hypothetical protein
MAGKEVPTVVERENRQTLERLPTYQSSLRASLPASLGGFKPHDSNFLPFLILYCEFF